MECSSARHLHSHTETLILYFWLPKLWGINFHCFMPSSLCNLLQLSLETNTFSLLSFPFHTLFFSVLFYPYFLIVLSAEQLAVFCVCTGFHDIYLGRPTEEAGSVEDGLPNDSCVKMWPNASNNHFYNLRLDCISELEFSCINNPTLTLSPG